jgi:hypothetical protein
MPSAGRPSKPDDVGLEQVDHVDRVGEDDLDPRQVAGRQAEQLVGTRRDEEDAPRRLERREHADEVAGLDRLEPERVHDLDRAVVELRRQRPRECLALHLAGQSLGVRARVRSEHRAAPAEVRRPAGTLARAAGALLAIRLGAAAANLAAGLRIVRAEAATGELGRHDLVQHGRVHGRREQLVGQLDAADGGPGAIVESRLRHGVRPSSRG